MKKRVNIILLLVVLTLWGTVAWRSLKNFLHQPEEVKNTTLYQSINLNKIKKDTFVLKRLNRDPFLHKSITSTTTNFKNSKKSLKSEINDQNGYLKVAGLFFSKKKCPTHAKPYPTTGRIQK